MNDCKKCFYYNKQYKKCLRFKCDISDTEIFGSVCKEFTKVLTKKVKCINCGNINKYGYCLVKKRCFEFEDRVKEKQCRSYFKKKQRIKIKY
jgi:hypothetical protein